MQGLQLRVCSGDLSRLNRMNGTAGAFAERDDVRGGPDLADARVAIGAGKSAVVTRCLTRVLLSPSSSISSPRARTTGACMAEP